MTFLISVFLFIFGLSLFCFGLFQAAIFYAARAWFDRQLSGEVARIGRDEVERIIGNVRSAFVRKYVLERLKDYGGKLAVQFVRGEITKFAHIGIGLSAIGVLLVGSALNLTTALSWMKSL